MNYAWEAALAADRAGLQREAVRYVPARDGSPYTEIVQETINSRDIEQNEVRLNPLYRFSREFAALFDINITDYEASRRIFFDACMQYFIRLDLRQGLSRQEYALRFLLDDLLNGVCGSQAGAVIKRFPKEKLRRLLRLVLKLYRCGSSINLFWDHHFEIIDVDETMEMDEMVLF